MNKVIIVGRLGTNPDFRTYDGGQRCSLSVATSEAWKDKTGEKKERTEWHRVILFGKIAEIASKYLAKGSEVLIEGKIQTREYMKDDEKHYTTEIIAQQIKFLGKRVEPSSESLPEDDSEIPF